MDDGSSRCKEGVSRDDHLPVLHADRPEDYLEGAGATVYGDCIRHPAKERKLFLELPAALAKSECAGR